MVLKQNKLADFGARWINIVADEQEVVFGTINEELQSTDVTWTKNHAMVNLAKEYVKHDAYTLKVIAESSEELKAKYGEDFGESERFTSRRKFYDSEYFAGTNCRNQSIFYYLLSKRPFQNKQNFKKNQGICVCCPSRHLSPSFFQHLAFPTLLSEPSFIKVEMGQHEKTTER